MSNANTVYAQPNALLMEESSRIAIAALHDVSALYHALLSGILASPAYVEAQASETRVTPATGLYSAVKGLVEVDESSSSKALCMRLAGRIDRMQLSCLNAITALDSGYWADAGRKERFDLYEQVQAASEVFGEDAASAGIRFVSQFHGRGWVLGYAEPIRVAVYNLVHNAVKYSFRGSGRYIELVGRNLSMPREVVLSISSFGVPLLREELSLDYLAAPGVRGEEARRERPKQGSGLGLSLARSAVESQGGRLTLTGDPLITSGNPRRFKVEMRLPAAPSFHG